MLPAILRDITEACVLAAMSDERAELSATVSDMRARPDDVPTLDHDPIKQNRIMISSLCLSMIFSENRFPLFRIML
jgi:hypothetical protein